MWNDRRIARGCRSAAILGIFLVAAHLPAAAEAPARTDTEAAAHYLEFALAEVDRGNWDLAEAVLDRGASFASSSSDLSYLQALVRSQLGRPAGAALAALRTARATDRWNRYTERACRHLEAAVLLRLHQWDAALQSLQSLPEDMDCAYLRLKALAGLDSPRFLPELRRALEAWPARSVFAELFCDRYQGRAASGATREIAEIIRGRLDTLSLECPALAWKMVPFLPDTAESARRLAAYRASGDADPRSLPMALDAGLVPESVAIEELFTMGEGEIDLGVLRSIWEKLRTDSSRELLARRLASYTGRIREDMDGDSWCEAIIGYRLGEVRDWSYDPDQDGLPELAISFSGGMPIAAAVALVGEAPAAAFPISDAERRLARVRWARYPFLDSIELADETFIAITAGFAWAPVSLGSLVGGSLVRTNVPRFDPKCLKLTLSAIVDSSSSVERPGPSGSGSREAVQLLAGIPIGAVETLDGRVLSRTWYEAGRPILRERDADGDGRLETKQASTSAARDTVVATPEFLWESSRSDWDGDGRVEYIERRLPDGRIEVAFDTDGDGLCERKELTSGSRLTR